MLSIIYTVTLAMVLRIIEEARVNDQLKMPCYTVSLLSNLSHYRQHDRCNLLLAYDNALDFQFHFLRYNKLLSIALRFFLLEITYAHRPPFKRISH